MKAAQARKADHRINFPKTVGAFSPNYETWSFICFRKIYLEWSACAGANPGENMSCFRRDFLRSSRAFSSLGRSGGACPSCPKKYEKEERYRERVTPYYYIYILICFYLFTIWKRIPYLQVPDETQKSNITYSRTKSGITPSLSTGIFI